MPIVRQIDVQDVLDAHPRSRVRSLVIALCFLVVFIDGFDTAAVGFIAPALRAEWNLVPAQLAPLFGAGLFGRWDLPGIFTAAAVPALIASVAMAITGVLRRPVKAAVQATLA